MSSSFNQSRNSWGTKSHLRWHGKKWLNKWQIKSRRSDCRSDRNTDIFPLRHFPISQQATRTIYVRSIPVASAAAAAACALSVAFENLSGQAYLLVPSCPRRLPFVSIIIIQKPLLPWNDWITYLTRILYDFPFPPPAVGHHSHRSMVIGTDSRVDGRPNPALDWIIRKAFDVDVPDPPQRNSTPRHNRHACCVQKG